MGTTTFKYGENRFRVSMVTSANKKNETSSGTNMNLCGRHSYTRYIQAHNEQREDYLLNILK